MPAAHRRFPGLAAVGRAVDAAGELAVLPPCWAWRSRARRPCPWRSSRRRMTASPSPRQRRPTSRPRSPRRRPTARRRRPSRRSRHACRPGWSGRSGTPTRLPVGPVAARPRLAAVGRAEHVLARSPASINSGRPGVDGDLADQAGSAGCRSAPTSRPRSRLTFSGRAQPAGGEDRCSRRSDETPAGSGCRCGAGCGGSSASSPAVGGDVGPAHVAVEHHQLRVGRADGRR